MEDQDHYKTLGISPNASLNEIKKAYKKLAMEYHPDKKPASQTHEFTQKFLEITIAYKILKNPEKRAEYDFHSNLQDYTPETLVGAIIIVTLQGIAYIYSESQKWIISTSKSWAIGARDIVAKQSKCLKDKSVEKWNSLKKVVNEKFQDTRQAGGKIFDQTKTKILEKCKTWKEKGIKKIDELKHSAHETIKKMIGSNDLKAAEADVEKVEECEELHSHISTESDNSIV
jgi:curved DNA-binding protein CbpA